MSNFLPSRRRGQKADQVSSKKHPLQLTVYVPAVQQTGTIHPEYRDNITAPGLRKCRGIAAEQIKQFDDVETEKKFSR